MMLINKLYGKKYIHLRTKIFEKGFGEGKGLESAGLTPEMVSWLEKAVSVYWRDRIHTILTQVGKMPSDMILNLWNEALDDMYGQDIERKKSLYYSILNNEKVSDKVKEWLRSIELTWN